MRNKRFSALIPSFILHPLYFILPPFPSAFSLYPLYFILLLPPSSFSQESICASVRIEILQQLTLERQAFEARMTINNGLAVALDNITVDVSFADKNNNTVRATSDPNDLTAKFFIRYQTGSGLPTSIGGGTSSKILWLIIPALGAAGSDPQGELYYVGATLRYRASGQDNTITVTPDSITVKPLPDLTLDYFLPAEVYGDDPFTVAVEPPVPYNLGVRVKNTGYGWARKLKIDSAQPQIVDNKLGLLVDFKILGSEVNGNPATSSLLADFGDIAPNRSGVARWIMTSSLSGRFVDFTAHYTHADELGGQLTSLLTGQPGTHSLIHDVLVDLPGRDNVRDFLAKDGNVLRVYESENADTPVPDYSAGASISGTDGRFTLRVAGFGGFAFFKLTDPQGGQYLLTSATRADGKLLNSANAWLSSTWDKTAQHWNYFVNLFDANNPYGLSYALKYAVPPSPTNRPPKLDPISDWTLVAGNYLSSQITATDPDDNRLTFTLDSGAPSGTAIDPVTGLFTWRPTQSQSGTTNVIRVRVTDNGAPNLSDVSSFTVTVKGNTSPTLDQIDDYIVDVLTTLRLTISASDPDLPENQLFFSLEPGAPVGARVNPTNGLFTWMPDRTQAASTNLITVTVTDNGAPPLSASRSFQVFVPDFIELTVGSANVLGGQEGIVPLTLYSSSPITNLNLALDYPGGRLSNWAAQASVPALVDGYDDPTNPGKFHLSFTVSEGQALYSNVDLAMLSFTGDSSGQSAFLPLAFSQSYGVRSDGTLVTNALFNNGRVALIVREPLNEAGIDYDGNKTLVVHGIPGKTYWVEYATSFSFPIQWITGWSITMDQQSQSQTISLGTSKAVFVRLREQ